MKKILISLLLVFAMLSSLLLVACGGDTTTTPQNQTDNSNTPGSTEQPAIPTVDPADANFQVPASGFDTSKPVTITFYHTMGQNLNAVLDNYIAEFNKLFPNITIEWTQVGNYDDVRDQISTELLAGNQPNIAYCYPDHVALYNVAGAVAQLDALIASTMTVTHDDGTTETLGLTQEQIDDFIQGYYDEGRQFGDGFMYSLPFSKSTEVLYYNKTFFEEHNLSVPTTWDEMEALCETIMKIDPHCVPLGYDSEANWFITMCEQGKTPYTSATGEHFLFNTPENRAFVKRFSEWYAKGYVTTQGLYGAYTSGLFIEPDPTMTRSYMSIGSSAGATHQRPDRVDGEYPFEVGIAPIPQLDTNNKKVISQGPSVCIFNDSDPQKVLASWLFVKYLTTNVEFQAEFSMVSGYVPVIKSVETNEAYANFLKSAENGNDGIAALSAQVCLDQEEYYYASPAFNGSSKARDEVGALLQKCLPLTGSNLEDQIEEAFEDAIDECEYFVTD